MQAKVLSAPPMQPIDPILHVTPGAESNAELLKSEHREREGEGDPETCTNLKKAPPLTGGA